MQSLTMTVLIIDDDTTNLSFLSTLAQAVADTRIVGFEDPVKALAWCAENSPDMLLVDYRMPVIDGMEFIRRFTALPDRKDVPIIMVTAETERAVRREALSIGATDFLAKPLDSIEFRIKVRNLLALRRSQTLLRDRALLLQSEVELAVAQMASSERELTLCLAKAVEYRDSETEAHVMRMSHYSALIAKKLDLPFAFQRMILLASPLHDVGKIGIPDQILFKAGPLDNNELAVMRQHCEIGESLLANSKSELMLMAAEIAGTHHEKFDGSGYPRGRAGEAIPLTGRIVAVADVFDALTSARPHKRAWSLDSARAFMQEQSGDHFCPSCVTAFLSGWEEILDIRKKFPDGVLIKEDMQHAA